MIHVQLRVQDRGKSAIWRHSSKCRVLNLAHAEGIWLLIGQNMIEGKWRDFLRGGIKANNWSIQLPLGRLILCLFITTVTLLCPEDNIHEKHKEQFNFIRMLFPLGWNPIRAPRSHSPGSLRLPSRHSIQARARSRDSLPPIRSALTLI